MFNCRVCSNTPFGSLFGYYDYDTYDTKKKKKKKGSGSSGTSDVHSYTGSGGEASDYTNRPENASSQDTFEMRSPEDVACLCRAWENYVHPRAKEFWRNSDQLSEILAFIARGCNKRDDPVLGDDSQCVRWHGELSAEDHLPIIRMTKPGESQESQTYVNRALVFLYANEQSFQELQAKPKKAFTMACGDPLCVNLTHISLDD